MACGLTSNDWKSVHEFEKGQVVLNAEFELELQGEQGLIDLGSQLVLREGAPLAVALNRESWKGLRFCRAEWNGDCAGDLVLIELAPFAKAGWSLRKDGKSLGYYADKSGHLFTFFINLVDFPVVLAMKDGALTLAFPDRPSQYSRFKM